MAEINQNIILYQGDDFTITTNIKDSSGNNQDITGATDVQWIVKKFEKDANAIITKNLAAGAVVQNASEGKVVISVDSADTLTLNRGRYYHELRYINSASKTTTVSVGYIDLKPTEEF